MFVVVATGLAVMGATVYSVLNGTATRATRPDRLSPILLLVSTILLVGAGLITLAHFVSG